MISIRRRATHALCLGALFTVALYAFWSTRPQPHYSRRPDSAPIPELARLAAGTGTATGPNAEFCRRRFSPAYLEELRDHSIEYCAPRDGAAAQSQLTCFHAHVRDDGGVDSMCIGTGASWNAADGKFVLPCPTLRQPSTNETERGLIPFASIATSWFDTGPRRVFDRFVSFSGQAAGHTTSSGKPPRNVILVKREGNNNLWHSLMEIQSMMSTVDVLRMAADGSTRQPFYRHPHDADNTHVVMLDDYPEEATFDLWRFFSRHPVVKLAGDAAGPDVPFPLRPEDGPFNIIVPLSGGSNPTWQNDWTDRADCTAAPLVALLVDRVYAHYGVARRAAPLDCEDVQARRPAITFIDRRGSRQLIGAAALLARLQARYPGAVVRSVDFAALPLADQLRLVQDTDILVGVHGAGLTHTMFLRAGYGAVVEIQPAGMGHKGFANMAAMTGHDYFMAEGDIVLPEEVGQYEEKPGAPRRDTDKNRPWQSSHVHIDAAAFLDIMEQAVEKMARDAAAADELRQA